MRNSKYHLVLHIVVEGFVVRTQTSMHITVGSRLSTTRTPIIYMYTPSPMALLYVHQWLYYAYTDGSTMRTLIIPIYTPSPMLLISTCTNN